MNLNMGAVQAANITNPQWELAQCISSGSMTPGRVFSDLFESIVQKIEKHRKVRFQESIKAKIWKEVAEKQIKILRHAHAIEVYYRVLDHLNKEQADQILKGSKDSEVRSFLLRKYKSQKGEIISALVACCDDMEDALGIELDNKLSDALSNKSFTSRSLIMHTNIRYNKERVTTPSPAADSSTEETSTMTAALNVPPLLVIQIIPPEE